MGNLCTNRQNKEDISPFSLTPYNSQKPKNTELYKSG